MKRIEIVNHDEKNQVQKTAENTDLANATEADGQTSQPSQSSFLNAKIFWGNDAVKLPTRYLYRGTISTPHQKFAEGFTARGTNPDLLLHVRPGGSWNIYGNYVANSDSVYISTSTSKQVGMFFPFGEARIKNGQTYLYQINPQPTAVDMLPVANLIDDAEYVKQIKAEKEMGVPHKIKPQDIKGAWTVKNGVLGIINPQHGFTRSGYTKNPNYIPSAPQYWRVPKAIRHTVTGLGVALDGWGLNLAYQKSIETNNYHHFFNESVRVAGGWSGSVALGQAGAAWCSPIPYGSLVCGVAGSFIGYLGGAQLGEMAYAHSKTDPDEIYTVSGCEMPIQANQASVLGNKIVNCIDKLVRHQHLILG